MVRGGMPFLVPSALWLLSALLACRDEHGLDLRSAWAVWVLWTPLTLLGLWLLRTQFQPLRPDLGFGLSLLALVLVIAASQGLLAAEDAGQAAVALARGQAAWLLFGFAAAVPLGWSGAFLLLWQQALLLHPLSRALDRAPGRVILVAGLFLGLSGAPPFSGFNAYFQLLAPYMTEGAAVTTMQAKLFSGTGLLAVLAILALLYQTGSFGYFYWSRVLPSAPARTEGQARLRPVPQPWAWAALLLSLVWGLAEHWGLPGRIAFFALRSLGAIPPLP